MSALAGVFWTLRFASARADNGTGLELAVVAAVLLGGVSIFGGRGGLVGVSPPCCCSACCATRCSWPYVPANTLTIVTGALLIASVVGPNVVAHGCASGCAGGDHRTTGGRRLPPDAAADSHRRTIRARNPSALKGSA